MTLTVTDMFCGAGGSSTGLTQHPAFTVKVAANHWQQALDTHGANHPDVDHKRADIHTVDPRSFPKTDVLWASPECTNHSVAKGRKRNSVEDPAAERSRATMWDVPRFAEYHQYQAIITENVVDAAKWVLFPAWLQAMQLLGYEHTIIFSNSMHAQAAGMPAPQSRDRMYVMFWRRGNTAPDVQRWTRPSAWCPGCDEVVQALQTWKRDGDPWGRYRTQYVWKCPRSNCRTVVEPAWLPAETAIDWSLPGQRIGDRDKPLADKTMRRIQAGINRHWGNLVIEAAGNTYDAADPRHPAYGTDTGYMRAWPATEPLRTLHGTSSKALVVPMEGREGKWPFPVDGPMRTLTARNENGLLMAYYGKGQCSPISAPIGTLTTRDHHALILPMRNNNTAKRPSDVLDTFAAAGNHHALVMRNNTGGAEMVTPITEPLRTLTTGGHQSLLAPGGSIAIEDCYFRMFEPHEQAAGMAFPADYIMLGSKRDRARQAGNAVCPPNARDYGYAVAESLGYEHAGSGQAV
ncbi:DNA cytosine methyltransferase [Tsukamurella columbiensis]|uniref:DNA (cytosine-5-)-methyltransferase n=1 Tax=Tsukamurella columbiensis TaxID=128509 RepID=A0ABX1LJ48_9ACTN|nr:DNA cytosine methyltransferase [Tsukamurella columbiensis]NMD58316.1 DNA cytosine methyltransferase [Tsukamurella columbiensis]